MAQSQPPRDTPSAEELQTIRRREAIVESRLAAGASEAQIIIDLQADGMTETAARDFVRRVASLRPEAQAAAGSKAGKGHLLAGFLLLAVGAGITVGTWASGGGSYWVMWGAMLWGIIHLVIGFSKKIANAPTARARQMWIGGGALLAAGVITGGLAAFNMITSPQPSEYIVFDSNSAWTSAMATTFQASGTITNTHESWSTKNLEVVVEGFDVDDKSVAKFTVLVTPSTIGPGQTATYSQLLTFPSTCVRAQEGYSGEWVKR